MRCMYACMLRLFTAFSFPISSQQEENAAVSAQQGAKAEEAEALARKLYVLTTLWSSVQRSSMQCPAAHPKVT